MVEWVEVTFGVVASGQPRRRSQSGLDAAYLCLSKSFTNKG